MDYTGPQAPSSAGARRRGVEFLRARRKRRTPGGALQRWMDRGEERTGPARRGGWAALCPETVNPCSTSSRSAPRRSRGARASSASAARRASRASTPSRSTSRSPPARPTPSSCPPPSAPRARSRSTGRTAGPRSPSTASSPRSSIVHDEPDGRAFLRAMLVPRLWRLTQTFHSRIFTQQAIPDILKKTLEDGGLTSADYALQLTGQYAPEEHVCQYRESSFDFFSRWMEREGPLLLLRARRRRREARHRRRQVRARVTSRPRRCASSRSSATTPAR